MENVKLLLRQVYYTVTLWLIAVRSVIKRTYRICMYRDDRDPWEKHCERKREEQKQKETKQEIACIGKATRTLILLTNLLPEADKTLSREDFEEKKSKILSYMIELKESKYEFDSETAEFIRRLTYERYTENSQEVSAQIKYVIDNNMKKLQRVE